jgi:dolichol kinase
MQVGLLIVALVSGLATVIFIMSGLRRALVRHKTLGLRALVLTTVFSLLTGVFTIWQLVLVAQQLHLAQ